MKSVMERLVEVGMALSSEKDLPTLLALILRHARELTGSDAASLYLVEQEEGSAPGPAVDLDGSRLYFIHALNDSVKVPFQKMTVPITRRSLAGYVAVTRETVNLKDVMNIPKGAPYRINRDFDESTGYKTISMLTMPLEDRHGNLSGVIQLINRRKRPGRPLGLDFGPKDVIAFDKESVKIVAALAAQAAVAVEDTRLFQSVNCLLEGIVLASVSAIESRDPTTSGHSERVARLTAGLAHAAGRCVSGPFAEISFGSEQIREIEYASLLHDFGKIGVREEILIKAKKLHPHELSSIEQRYKLAGMGLRLRAAEGKFLALARDKDGHKHASVIDERLAKDLAELEGKLRVVRDANNPTILAEGSFDKISDMAKEKIALPGCGILTFLSPREAARLGIRKGSLSANERKEIEQHVVHTFAFLSRIPWTKGLRRVPEIARDHHEKMNGTGYPRGLKGVGIPIESRMMTICDIYDALTAWDRPYKKAVPEIKALGILEEEASHGALDKELLKLFIEARVFRLVSKNAGAA